MGDSNTCFQHLYESLFFEDIKGCESNVSSSSRAQTQRKIIAQLYYSAVSENV